MSSTVIEINNLSKRFTLSHQHRPDSLKAWLRSYAQRAFQRDTGQLEDCLWALNDISLKVDQGQCLALIGKNGSGKSTLLKILSRIIPPTQGHIRIRGRIAALLEVGTGFHPELTGRENIFLNGAMLGCTEREIRHRFDAIVHFSEVERFLDTPVKHYSSGMYVRLAYSVAAHVDADILVIDEVLAVGDSDFQKKCYEHLESQFARGVTGILVSHNLRALKRLASHVAWLENGCLKETGQIHTGILERYDRSS